MNIVHINAHDIRGGAGKAAYRLALGLRNAGYNARMLVRVRTSNETWIQSIPSGKWVSQLFNRTVVRFGDIAGFPDLWLPATRNLLRHTWVQHAEVINLHNIHGRYFSLPALRQLSYSKPLIWTLHDMWAFTGHCGYSFSCQRWKYGCGECPFLKSPPPLRRDTTRLLWKTRKAVYRASRLQMVTPSRWLAQLAQESPLLKNFSVQVIPNSVDTTVFRPRNRSKIRAKLGLPLDRFLLFFMSYQVNDYRKGGDLLYDALHRLSSVGVDLPIDILLAGTVEETAQHQPFPFRYLGHISEDQQIADYYAAADLFVLPSRQDNLPNGLLESIACGTPVVAFDVGGISEVIRPHQTGYLIGELSADALAAGIRWCLQNPEDLRRLRSSCRRIAVQEYDMSIQARAYAALYRSAIREYRSSEIKL